LSTVIAAAAALSRSSLQTVPLLTTMRQVSCVLWHGRDAAVPVSEANRGRLSGAGEDEQRSMSYLSRKEEKKVQVYTPVETPPPYRVRNHRRVLLSVQPPLLR
jgi:hypothetical protein